MRISHILACASAALLLLAAHGASAAPAKLVLLDLASGARCLDGSPSGFYFQPASTAAGAHNWVIHLEGGGECASEEACKARVSTAQGSSKFFEPTRQLGMLNSDDQASNPLLYDANHVLLPYCVGDLWSGTAMEAGPKTWGLYFTGHLTVIAAIEALKRDWQLKDASSTQIVLAGDSAGGIGTWINADHIQQSLLPFSRLSIASFAGFYFTANPYTGPDHTTSHLALFTADGLRYNAGLWSSFVDESCADGHRAAGADPALCLLANNSLPYIDVPAFVFESLSDAVQLTAHDSIPDKPLLCNAPEQTYLTQWRQQMTFALAPLLQAQDARHGVFAPACWVHVFLQGPMINGSSAYQTYSNWFTQSTQPDGYKIVDQCQGNFCNPSCANPCAHEQEQQHHQQQDDNFSNKKRHPRSDKVVLA